MWDIRFRDHDGSLGFKIRYYEEKCFYRATGFSIMFNWDRVRFWADLAYRVAELGLPQFNLSIGRTDR